MKTSFLSAISSVTSNRGSSGLGAPRFIQKYTNAAAARARYPVPPLGSLWDPHLVDRLQSRLTRYRD